MNPTKLTTITPYWGRPEMLRNWITAIRGATLTGVEHIIYFVGSPPPDWWNEQCRGLSFQTVYQPEAPGLSIGHYHNLGARRAQSEWIMKLDVDTVPNVNYFPALLKVISSAKEKEWFNGGMLMLSRNTSIRLKLPLGSNEYIRITSIPRLYTSAGGWFPQGTNFICRKDDYLSLGGCDERFQGYGWEDYQQIFMLEKNQSGSCPLPGLLDLGNITQRCREEISRKKAAELYARDSSLCLLHQFHPPAEIRSREQMEKNRGLLFSYVLGTS